LRPCRSNLKHQSVTRDINPTSIEEDRAMGYGPRMPGPE
jgi:hypothetical protein